MISPPASPAVIGSLVFVLGACIGSFLNVVIRRLPEEESIVLPGSHCECGAPLAWRDLIPIVSWILLRGRARCCGRRISPRYPLVEALTGGLFLACWWEFPLPVALCGAFFLSALAAATFIDLDHLMIPDVLTVGVAIAGFVLSAFVPALHGAQGGVPALDAIRSAGSALAGILIGSGVLFWIATLAERALGRESLGLGDVKLAGAIGAFCGWRGAIFALFGGAVAGTVALALYLAFRALRRQPAGVGVGTRLPFGPMLAFAGALYFLFVRGPVDRWFDQVSQIF